MGKLTTRALQAQVEAAVRIFWDVINLEEELTLPS